MYISVAENMALEDYRNNPKNPELTALMMGATVGTAVTLGGISGMDIHNHLIREVYDCEHSTFGSQYSYNTIQDCEAAREKKLYDISIREAFQAGATTTLICAAISYGFFQLRKIL